MVLYGFWASMFAGIAVKRPCSIRRTLMVTVIGLIYGPMEFFTAATPYADPEVAVDVYLTLFLAAVS